MLGYIFLRLELDAAPLMLGFILGPMLEENFRRAMLISRGSFAPFVTRPISAVLVGLISLFFAWQLISFFLDQQKLRAAARPPRRPGRAEVRTRRRISPAGESLGRRGAGADRPAASPPDYRVSPVLRPAPAPARLRLNY